MIQNVNKYHIYEILSADGNFYYTFPNLNTYGIIVSGKHCMSTLCDEKKNRVLDIIYANTYTQNEQ